MNAMKSLKLMELYAKCPKCGSDSIGNGQGEITVEENIFKRKCKCGYSIELKEGEV